MFVAADAVADAAASVHVSAIASSSSNAEGVTSPSVGRLTTTASLVVSGEHNHVIGELIDIFDSGTHKVYGITKLNFRDSLSADEAVNVDAAVTESSSTGYTTVIEITAAKAKGSVYSTVEDGTGYTKTGDDANLLVNASSFNNEEVIEVFYNGAYCHKGQDVVWQSSSTFELNIQADIGDKIIILSKPLVPTRTTILTITASKDSGSLYDVTDSGTGYTHSGDDGVLTNFTDEIVSIFYNGVYCHKGIEVVKVSDSTFTLEIAVDPDDEIIIIS